MESVLNGISDLGSGEQECVKMIAAFVKESDEGVRLFVQKELGKHGLTMKFDEQECAIFGWIHADTSTLFALAEELHLVKELKSGEKTAFKAARASEFVINPKTKSILTQADQLVLLHYVLDKIFPDPAYFDDIHGRETLLMWCERQGHISDVFALHDESYVNEIMKRFSMKKQILDDSDISLIREYFGDKTALYFCFLSFYTKCLRYFGVFGFCITLLCAILPSLRAHWMVLFSVFASVWGVVFIAGWKRKNTEIGYKWRGYVLGDTEDDDAMQRAMKEELRPQFQGVLEKDPVTGEDVYVFPTKEKYFRYGISALIVFLCLFVVTQVTLMTLDYTDIVNNWIGEYALLYWWSKPFLIHGILIQNLPLVLYLVALNVFTILYNYIAEVLNNWENHKYEYEYENSMVLKLVVFQFLSMNMSYLYMAFVLRSYDRLAAGIRNVLLIELVTGNIKETLIPYVLRTRKEKAKRKEMEKHKKEDTVTEPSNPAVEQFGMEESEGALGDYFELTRQFTLVAIFAAAFPLGSIFGCLNNHIELYSDCFKRCYLSRRNIPTRAYHIGSWLQAFDLLSIISVMSNLGIIGFTAGHLNQLLGPESDEISVVILLICMEHLIFAMRVFAKNLIPQVPGWIRIIRAKERYMRFSKND